MYTEENVDYNDTVYVEENNEFSWKKLLIRILIIFVCLLLAIWLISKLVGGNKNKNDGTVFNDNLDTIRLASEKYFFIENNLPVDTDDSLTITLSEMNSKGLVATIVDYKENVCSTASDESFAKLTKTSIAYELVIKLTCDEENDEITYYYDLSDYKCLSCSGNTYMDGSLVIEDNEDEEDNTTYETYQKYVVVSGDTLNKIAVANNTTVEELKKINNLTSDTISVGQTLLIPNNNNTNSDDDKLEISCDKWSDWTTTKLTDSNLLVRTRTLIKGFKNIGETTPVYGNWTEWSKTPVTGSTTLQVETKTENEPSWSDNKTTKSYSKISDSSKYKIVDTSTSGGKTTCNTNYSNVRTELTASEYASYNAKGLIVKVHKVYNKKTCDNCTSNYTIMYDVTYKKASKNCTTTDKVTTYTYQELISTPVTYYRSRTITQQESKDNTVYTDYVETLPEGYTKVEGSDLIQYSYKETICK